MGLNFTTIIKANNYYCHDLFDEVLPGHMHNTYIVIHVDIQLDHLI